MPVSLEHLPEPIQRQWALCQEAQSRLDRYMDRLAPAFAQSWEGQVEYGRTLVSLSAGALVLSITVTQFLAGRITHPMWTPLLPTSWVLFALTATLGAVRHTYSSGGRSLFVRVAASSDVLESKIMSLEIRPLDAELDIRLREITREVIDEATLEPFKAIRIHDWLTSAMFWSFVGGFTSLLAFAMKNLPF